MPKKITFYQILFSIWGMNDKGGGMQEDNNMSNISKPALEP